MRTPMPLIRSLVSVCLLVSLLAMGCASISGTLPPPRPLEPSGSFKAGSAKIDITPMPGFPMGGYAAGGKISRGVWTRLYARAAAFEDTDGYGVALVSCDLWAMPAGLADRAAELAAKQYGAPELGREQIVIAATHTHNGPGNFSSSFFYNQFASPKSGFDKHLFNYLAHRIAMAIGQAWQNRQPAVLRRSEMDLGGIARNRSLTAFMENGEPAQRLIQHNDHLHIVRTPFPAGGDNAYRAVDPTLTVIRAEPATGNGPLLAVMAFYAVHPTAMGSSTQVYSSDLFGAAATLVEDQLGGTVTAIFNGAEGDVSSNWARQDRPSTLDLAGHLAGGIQQLLAEPGRDVTGPVRFSYGHCNLDELAKPIGGASQLQGSEGDWAFFRDAGWREGLTEDDPEKQIEGHGVKKHPFSEELLHSHLPVNMPFILDKILNAPEEVPLGAYRIGDVYLGTLPGEFTTMLGRRISGSMAQAAGSDDRVLMVGLANEYLSYFTTEEEYSAQHYEGASMLYGPKAPAAIESTLVGLTRELESIQLREKKLKYKYGAGPKKTYGVKEFDLLKHQDRYEVTYMTLGNVLMDAETGIPTPYNPYAVWIDANPRWGDDPGDGRAVTPRVVIEIENGGGWETLVTGPAKETDDGLNFVTTVVGSFAGETRWITTWMVPDGIDESERYRFAVQSTTAREFFSEPFTLDEAFDNWGFVGFLEWSANSAED